MMTFVGKAPVAENHTNGVHNHCAPALTHSYFCMASFDSPRRELSNEPLTIALRHVLAEISSPARFSFYANHAPIPFPSSRTHIAHPRSCTRVPRLSGRTYTRWTNALADKTPPTMVQRTRLAACLRRFEPLRYTKERKSCLVIQFFFVYFSFAQHKLGHAVTNVCRQIDR